MFEDCSEISISKVILLNMSDILELSGFLTSLGGHIKFFNAWRGQKKLLVCGLSEGIS